MKPANTRWSVVPMRLPQGGVLLLLVANAPEARAQDGHVEWVARQEQKERFFRKLNRAFGDVAPLVVPTAIFTFLIGVAAFLQFRSRFANRFPRLQVFFGRPVKLTSRRDLAPQPSPLSPHAGRIPLLNRRTPLDH